MPNFKVFSETPSQLLAQVSNSTAASLVTQVTNLTAGSLVTQMTNTTPASLQTQVSNTTAASLLSQVSNTTAASLLSQVSNTTAASLVSQVGGRATTNTGTDIADSGTTTYKDTTAQDVLQLTQLTFTVINSGTSNTAQAKLMLSADDVTYSADPTVTAQSITPAQQYFFVPGRFTKYAKIQYASLTAGLTTPLSLYFQACV